MTIYIIGKDLGEPRTPRWSIVQIPGVDGGIKSYLIIGSIKGQLMCVEATISNRIKFWLLKDFI